MRDYSKGKIYKIVCNTTNDTYYGSTIENYLSDRLSGHVRGYRRWRNGKANKCMSYDIIERENYKAIWKFKPKSFDGDLHLIRSSSAHGWYSDPVMGWKDIIRGKIHTYRIKGNHSDFVESPQLVDALNKLIN